MCNKSKLTIDGNGAMWAWAGDVGEEVYLTETSNKLQLFYPKIRFTCAFDKFVSRAKWTTSAPRLATTLPGLRDRSILHS
jgi:hypothetical protein